MKSLNLKSFDPRRGESFDLNAGKWTFSSLSSRFLVLDGHSVADAERFSAPLKKCVQGTSAKAFAVVRPWMPGARNLRSRLREKLPDLVETSGTLSAFFSPTALDEVLAIRRGAGAGQSGEWIFGGCIAPDARDLLDRHALPLVSLLKHADEIGCLLSFGEHEQVTFMTKLFEGVDAIAAEVAAATLRGEREGDR